jgi:hypothetical protein
LTFVFHVDKEEKAKGEVEEENESDLGQALKEDAYSLLYTCKNDSLDERFSITHIYQYPAVGQT